MNPTRLEPSLRQAVCEQCHLQGASRIVRRGRDLYDYRPGLPLHLFWSVFLRPAEFRDQQFVGHVEQMHESRCYRESKGAGKMGCTSCHDPHAVPPAERKASFFRGRCLSCHAQTSCGLSPATRRQTSPEDSCVACHMPRRPSADIAHTATTDHRIVRRADGRAGPATAPRLLRPGDIPLEHFHADQAGAGDPALGRDLGLALVDLAQQPSQVKRQLSETALPLLEKATQQGPEDVRAWEGRGQALWSLGRAREALASAEEALARAPTREQALANAAAWADSLGRRKAAIAYWKRALAVNPTSSLYRFRLAQLLSEEDDWLGALAECERVLRDDPANIPARLLKVAHHIHTGDRERACIPKLW